MASYYHYNAHPSLPSTHGPALSSAAVAQQQQQHHHHSHTIRSRGAHRLRQNPHKQYRSIRKDEEAAALITFRQRFELQRSFDLDDDLEFCPMLVNDTDGASVHSSSSSSSDRASLSSSSPESSPQSHSVAPESSFRLNANPALYVPSSFPVSSSSSPLKLHQPAATRIRSAIPIVNPSTGLSMSSPPQSVSPTRMQGAGQRW